MSNNNYSPYVPNTGSAAPVVVQGSVVRAPGGGGGGDTSGGFANALDQGYTGNNNSSSNAPYVPAQTYNNNNKLSSSQTGYTNAAALDNNGNSQMPQHAAAKNSGGCRDAGWGVFFYIHLAGIAYLAAVYGPQAVAASGNGGGGRLLQAYDYFVGSSTNDEQIDIQLDGRALDEYNNNGGSNYNNGDYTAPDIDMNALITVTAIAGIVGCIISSLAMGFMIKFAEGLIKAALFFNIGICALMALASLAAGAIPGALMGGLMCAFSAYYAYRVWSRIPFAAANMVTAVTAVRANIGLALYAYVSLVLLFLWTIVWSVSAGSTIMVLSQCDGDGECANEVNGIVMFLLLISYYWTIQVITNVVHVTVAGTVGTWWFVPQEANGCCSQAVRESYIRSMTTSFGSICFGSLIVAIIQATKEMLHQMRESGDSMVVCIAECLVGCLESLVEYFNKWAFVYVGLYSFSFMEAGKNVMTLFRNRGWTTIITDLMVDTVLSMVSFGVGALTALTAFLVGSALQMGDMATLGAASMIGFVLGFGMSSTLFSLVSSAVNTVVVCYAEAPNEFQQNHPELSNNMREAWRQAFPNDFGY